MKSLNAHKNGYKPSPLCWIPKEWKDLTIDNIISFSGGSQPPQSTFVYEPTNGYIRLVQTRDYRTNKYPTFIPIESARKICNTEDIMIGRYGPPLFQIFRGIPGAYNVALIKAIPDETIVDKNYCWYYLQRPEIQLYLEGLSQRSGGQTGIEMDRLKDYPFPVPSFSEQHKIASILGTWDTAISRIQHLIIQLKERNKGLLQKIASGIFRLSGFDNNWDRVNINQVATEVSLKNKKDEALTVLSCTKYYGLVDSLTYFGRKIYSDDTSTYKIVPQGHFAYATNHIEEGSIGYQTNYPKALISPMYTVFKTNGLVNDEFFFKLLKSHSYIHQYKKRMEGSIDRRGGLRWEEFGKIPVYLPEYDEQVAINKILNTANDEVKLYEQKLAALQLQKKGLMQKLLTGEVRVKLN